MEEKNHNIISKINKLIALAKNYSNIEEIEKLKETIDKKVKKLEYDEFIRNNPIGFNFEVIVEEENSSFPLYHLYLNYALNGNLHRINLSQQLHMTAFLGKDSFFVSVYRYRKQYMVAVECKDYNNTTYFKFTTSPRVEVEHIFRPDEDIYEAFDILTRLFPDRLKSLNRRKNKYLNYFHKSYLSNDDLILTFCAKDGNNYVCRYDK